MVQPVSLFFNSQFTTTVGNVLFKRVFTARSSCAGVILYYFF